jgi:hypothetical protein
MTVRLERVGDRYGIFLTGEELAELCLQENDPLELRVVKSATLEVERSSKNALEYATDDEAMAAYKRTEPRYAPAYEELAK